MSVFDKQFCEYSYVIVKIIDIVIYAGSVFESAVYAIRKISPVSFPFVFCQINGEEMKEIGINCMLFENGIVLKIRLSHVFKYKVITFEIRIIIKNAVLK